MDERDVGEQGNARGREAPLGEPTTTPVRQPGAEAAGPVPGTLQTDIVMIGLAYFGIFGLIPYLSAKDDPEARWHAKQGLTLTAACLVAIVPLAIVGAVLAFVPVLGPLVSGLMWLAFSLGVFVAWLVALVKAFGGTRWKIPIIGDLAERW